jgi:hypothetical protein
MNHSSQHQGIIHNNELYYTQEGFDFLQGSSSQFPRVPFQPQPSPLGRYVGYEREGFETLRTYDSLAMALVCINLLKSTLCTR